MNPGVREAENARGMEGEELQVLVASLWPRSRPRLPDMEERDASCEFLRAACPRGPRDRSHGAATPDKHTKTPESSKTCLSGDTSFMHLKTEENRTRDVGQARRE